MGCSWGRRWRSREPHCKPWSAIRWRIPTSWASRAGPRWVRRLDSPLGFGAIVGGLGLPLCAFIGGGLSIILVYGIAASQGQLPMHQLLLAGVIMNAVCSALMMFVTSILNPASLYRVVFG